MRALFHQLVALAVFCAILLSPRPLFACPVCIDLPEETLADHILSAQVLALARPALQNPFEFMVVEALQGAPAELDALPEIPFLVDSVTRAAFRSGPDKSVLMIYGASRTDAAGRSVSTGWRRAFMMTPERARFVEAVLAEGKNWSLGKTAEASRVTFFAEYLTHKDPVLRDASLTEIDRAPYRLVRSLRDIVPLEQLLSELRQLNRIAYLPVTIRLLGMQTETDAHQEVRSRFRAALEIGGRNLHAWALAGVEVDGARAITLIGNALVRSDLTGDEKQDLIRALSDWGDALPANRSQIVEVYERVIERDPSLAGWIAFAMYAWRDTSLNAQFGTLLDQDRIDPAARYMVQIVLNDGR